MPPSKSILHFPLDLSPKQRLIYFKAKKVTHLTLKSQVWLRKDFNLRKNGTVN